MKQQFPQLCLTVIKQRLAMENTRGGGVRWGLMKIRGIQMRRRMTVSNAGTETNFTAPPLRFTASVDWAADRRCVRPRSAGDLTGISFHYPRLMIRILHALVAQDSNGLKAQSALFNWQLIYGSSQRLSFGGAVELDGVTNQWF